MHVPQDSSEMVEELNRALITWVVTSCGDDFIISDADE